MEIRRPWVGRDVICFLCVTAMEIIECRGIPLIGGP